MLEVMQKKLKYITMVMFIVKVQDKAWQKEITTQHLTME